MRSYFSQLAKQSGLPVAVSGKRLHSQIKSSEDVQAKPLHREETVFTSSPSTVSEEEPTLPKDKVAKSNRKQTTLENSPKLKSEDRSPHNNSQSEKPKSEKPYISEIEIPEKNSPIEVSKTGVIEGDPKEISAKEKPDSESEELNLTKGVSQSRREIIEEFPEKVKTEEVKPEENLISGIAEISETKIEKEDTEPKEYFEKTSRILEEREGSPQKIQQVFLQEIQQWVADAPVLKEEKEKPEIEKIETVAPPPLKESRTLVVREDDKIPKANADSAENQPAEQNLNLSIGTISVVIEDSEDKIPVVENLPKQNSGNDNRSKSERSFSRLSRHYL